MNIFSYKEGFQVGIVQLNPRNDSREFVLVSVGVDAPIANAVG